MNLKLLFALFLLSALPSVGVQSSASDHTDQATVLALENAWNQAAQQQDAAALDLLFGVELVYIDYDGTLMSKAEYLASVKTQSFHTTRIVNESVTSHSYGDAIVVYGIWHEIGTLSNGKPYSRRERFTDLWVRRKGTWVCVASQSTSIP